MRLTVKTAADVRSGLFIDVPGQIYGSSRLEKLARYPLQVLRNVYDSFLKDQVEEARKYDDDMAEYDRKMGKFEAVSKRRRSILGMKEPEKPEKPDTITPAARKLSKSMVTGTREETMRIVLDSDVVFKGSARVPKLHVRIRIEKPDMSAFSVRGANSFNMLGGLNRHAHWLARDYERTIKAIFDNSVEHAAFDLRGSTVEIVDECPLPADVVEEFEENCRRAMEEADAAEAGKEAKE